MHAACFVLKVCAAGVCVWCRTHPFCAVVCSSHVPQRVAVACAGAVEKYHCRGGGADFPSVAVVFVAITGYHLSDMLPLYRKHVELVRSVSLAIQLKREKALQDMQLQELQQQWLPPQCNFFLLLPQDLQHYILEFLLVADTPVPLVCKAWYSFYREHQVERFRSFALSTETGLAYLTLMQLILDGVIFGFHKEYSVDPKSFQELGFLLPAKTNSIQPKAIPLLMAFGSLIHKNSDACDVLPEQVCFHMCVNEDAWCEGDYYLGRDCLNPSRAILNSVMETLDLRGDDRIIGCDADNQIGFITARHIIKNASAFDRLDASFEFDIELANSRQEKWQQQQIDKFLQLPSDHILFDLVKLEEIVNCFQEGFAVFPIKKDWFKNAIHDQVLSGKLVKYLERVNQKWRCW